MSEEIKYIKNFYNKHAKRWTSKPADPFYHETPFRKFEKLLKPGNTVLDIGCAGGIHAPLFLGIGKKLKYEGIDISEKMIGIAKSRYPQLKFSTTDLVNFKSKKRFSGFWAAAVLMHIPEKDLGKALTNIEKITKPKAIGYITLPITRPNEENEKDKRHFTLYTINDFKKLTKARGWKILNSGSLNSKNKELIWNWYIVKLP